MQGYVAGRCDNCGLETDVMQMFGRWWCDACGQVEMDQCFIALDEFWCHVADIAKLLPADEADNLLARIEEQRAQIDKMMVGAFTPPDID